MKSFLRRGFVTCMMVVLGLLALLPASANAPFNTREVATAVLNPYGVPSIMKVDSAGRPIFAFFSGYEFQTDYGTVDVVRCNDTTCSSSTRHTVAEDIPADTSLGLALDANQNPAVAFSYNVPGEVSVRVVRCADPACEVAGEPGYLAAGTAPALQVIDFHLSPGDRPAAALDHPGEYALFERCETPDCDGALGSLLSFTPSPNSNYSIAYGTAGFPVVSFQEDGLVAAFCTTNDCFTDEVTVRPIDTSDPGVGQYNTVEIHPTTGFPVFAYSDQGGNLKIAFCSDVDCLGARTVETLSTDGTQGSGISLVFEDGNPVVVSRTSDTGDQRIRWIRCMDTACNQTQTYIVDGPHSGLGSTPPLMSYRNDNDEGFRIGFYQRDAGTLNLLYASTLVGKGFDVDCNGYYDALDAQILLRSLAGLEENATPVEPCDLDVNDDTFFNMLDVLWMRRLAAGFFS